MPTASVTSPQMQKELAIALRAEDRRGDLGGNLVPALLRKLPELAKDPTMLCRVAHDATLPDGALADLELRLDQRHDIARRAEQLADARQHQPQGNERDVDHGQIRWDWQPIQVPDVDPLHQGDPWVLAQGPSELAIADIDRDHPCGAPLQQEVGKTPGRCADIEDDSSCRVDAKGIKRARELVATPADIRLGAVEVDADAGVDHLIRPVGNGSRDSHQAGAHHRLGALPRRHEPLGDEGLVQADAALNHQRHIPSPTIIPSRAPAITSIGVCPSSSRSRSWRMPWCAMNRSSISRFRIIACWPAARRTPVASYMTTLEKIRHTAKSGDCTPSRRPIMVVSETTSALCELGIPPAVASRRTLNRCSTTESMMTLQTWAIPQAMRGTTKYGFRSNVTDPVDARLPVPGLSTAARPHPAAGRSGAPVPGRARSCAPTRRGRPVPSRAAQPFVPARRRPSRNPSDRSQPFPSPFAAGWWRISASAAIRPRIPLTNLPESGPPKVLASSIDSLMAALSGTLGR